MRIVIDMQGAQTASRFRGIGRYTLSFAKGVVRNRGKHEVILALSGFFPDAIQHIRASFDGLIPQENIRVWNAPGPVEERNQGHETRREVAEHIREAFLASLQPDIIHVSSMFEGYADDAVTSIGKFDKQTPVSVALYDLIPLLNPDQYLKPSPSYNLYYRRKLGYFKQASLFLAISEYSRQEAIAHLDIPESQVVNVSTAIEPHFQPLNVAEQTAQRLRQKLGLSRPFVLYSGGADDRKNLPRLIQAWSTLPFELRQNYQLVFAGQMPEANIDRFKKIAQSAELKTGELLFTGYVSDEELILLYNLCIFYVFPSWHEGFGLPALEAMSCGAPVIGANTSSLPEVISLNEAMFNPMDVSAIASKLQEGLVDDGFRNRLRDHGLKQAKHFSWDESAKRAISAWETITVLQCRDYLNASLSEIRLYENLAPHIYQQGEKEILSISACLALNQQAGIERQLFLDVSELCQHDSATGVQRVVRSYLKWLLESPPKGFRVEPVYATLDKGYSYARKFTCHFLGIVAPEIEDTPIRWQRGDIFFGLDMQHHVQLAHTDFYQKISLDGVVVKFMVYDLLPIQLEDLFNNSSVKELHEKLLSMIVNTDGAICISKATADALKSWINSFDIIHSSNFCIEWVHIGGDIEGSKPSLGIPENACSIFEALDQRPTFLCVSTIEPRKRQQQILEATDKLWKQKIDVNLVFVGQQGWKTEALVSNIKAHRELGKRLFWLQGISDEYLRKIYASSTCLIAASINEGFGLSLIEAAQHNISIIARDIPIFREVAGEFADYFYGDTPEDLANFLLSWLDKFRQGKHKLSKGMPWLTWKQSSENLKIALVDTNYSRRQLLVDISELVQRDAKSGIQRVVRSLLNEWFINKEIGYRVEPIFATHENGYRYAKKFTANFFGNEETNFVDEAVEFAPGDIFLGLDLAPAVVPAHREFYQKLRRSGVTVAFVIYDLLPLIDDYFEKAHSDACTRWLDVATSGDMAICISESVSSELRSWLKLNKPHAIPNLKIQSFHLGADIEHSIPTVGLTENSEGLLKIIKSKPSFLMVSTLAPHKGHTQVLDAFELLWSLDIDVNLVIVGKQGWRVEELVKRLKKHPELNNRLFWLEGISDEYLLKVYSVCSCLIAASFGEGFGLPLIEAAQKKLPIMARDINVFREVALSHAYYFKADNPQELMQSILSWLDLYSKNMHPSSEKMPWLTWKESSKQLIELLNNVDIKNS